MKKVLAVLTVLLALVVVGCGEKETAKEDTLVVGATAVPHAEILKEVAPVLEQEGIKLDVVEYTDYTTPNMSLDAGDLDANFFQHQPYLDDFNEKKGTNLVSIAKIHFEPMGLYSKKINSINELKEGARVGIPGDATNGGRALVVLEKAGLIKLKDGVGIAATVRDIEQQKVDIVEAEAAQLPRSLDDLDAAVINGNYAVQAGLTPTDALIAEDAQSEAANTYANILVVRKGDEKREDLQKLAEAMQSKKVKQFIKENYQGAVIPVF